MEKPDQAFEKWAKSKLLDVAHDNHSNPCSLYWYGTTQEFWECWKAAQASVGGAAYCHCKIPDVRSNGQVIMCWKCGHAPTPAA